MKTPKSLDPAWMQDRQEKLTAQLAHISRSLAASEPSLEEKVQAREDPKEVAKLRGTIDRLLKRRAELEQEQAVLQAHLLGTEIKWQASLCCRALPFGRWRALTMNAQILSTSPRRAPSLGETLSTVCLRSSPLEH